MMPQPPRKSERETYTLQAQMIQINHRASDLSGEISASASPVPTPTATGRETATSTPVTGSAKPDLWMGVLIGLGVSVLGIVILSLLGIGFCLVFRRRLAKGRDMEKEGKGGHGEVHQLDVSFARDQRRRPGVYELSPGSPSEMGYGLPHEMGPHLEPVELEGSPIVLIKGSQVQISL
jgi:hypothetical protein